MSTEAINECLINAFERGYLVYRFKGIKECLYVCPVCHRVYGKHISDHGGHLRYVHKGLSDEKLKIWRMSLVKFNDKWYYYGLCLILGELVRKTKERKRKGNCERNEYYYNCNLAEIPDIIRHMNVSQNTYYLLYSKYIAEYGRYEDAEEEEEENITMFNENEEQVFEYGDLENNDKNKYIKEITDRIIHAMNNDENVLTVAYNILVENGIVTKETIESESDSSVEEIVIDNNAHNVDNVVNVMEEEDNNVNENNETQDDNSANANIPMEEDSEIEEVIESIFGKEDDNEEQDEEDEELNKKVLEMIHNDKMFEIEDSEEDMENEMKERGVDGKELDDIKNLIDEVVQEAESEHHDRANRIEEEEEEEEFISIENYCSEFDNMDKDKTEKMKDLLTTFEEAKELARRVSKNSKNVVIEDCANEIRKSNKVILLFELVLTYVMLSYGFSKKQCMSSMIIVSLFSCTFIPKEYRPKLFMSYTNILRRMKVMNMLKSVRLKERLTKCKQFSIAVDDTSKRGKTRMGMYVRIIQNEGTIVQERIALSSYNDDTTSLQIFNWIKKTITDLNGSLSNCISIYY